MHDTTPSCPAAELPPRKLCEPDSHGTTDARTAPPSPAPLPAGLLAGGSQTGYLGPATVIAGSQREGLVLVQWDRAGQPCLSWARPALAAATQLRPGDTALMLSQDLEAFYLIGVLAESGSRPLPAALQTSSGASVAITRTAGQEVVQIRSPQGALVTEYHPESGKMRIQVENGDLEFSAPNGSISFQSAQKISLNAPRLESQAETIVSQAANVYETVEELAQLQAGRTRTLVKGSCHLKARDAFMKAEQDFKVDGEQIHLG